jgi:hypothetical protein
VSLSISKNLKFCETKWNVVFFWESECETKWNLVCFESLNVRQSGILCHFVILSVRQSGSFVCFWESEWSFPAEWPHLITHTDKNPSLCLCVCMFLTCFLQFAIVTPVRNWELYADLVLIHKEKSTPSAYCSSLLRWRFVNALPPNISISYQISALHWCFIECHSLNRSSARAQRRVISSCWRAASEWCTSRLGDRESPRGWGGIVLGRIASVKLQVTPPTVALRSGQIPGHPTPVAPRLGRNFSCPTPSRLKF